MPPRVTAVIPVHNHASWVWDAVMSVANQDYAEKAIVVVDDGSKDGSFDAVAHRLYKPSRGRYIGMQEKPDLVMGTVPNNGTRVMVLRFNEAHGPSFARNRGIEVGLHAADFQAGIFALLDSDDLYEPGKISKSVRYFVDHPDHVGAVYSDYETLRPDGLRVREFKESFSRRRLLQECIVNCDSLVSRKAIEACDGFDESLRVAEDYDLWLRISERFVIIHVPEPLVTIRVGSHSSTTTVPNETWRRCHAQVFEKLKRRVQNG